VSLLVVLSAMITVVADTEVQRSARSLDIVFLLPVSPVFMAVCGVAVGGVRRRLKRSASLSLSKH